MNRRRKSISLLWGVIFIILFSACGPSQEELDATATQAAVEQFATQTIETPTATQNPTHTPTPTPTYTLKPTITPTAIPLPTNTPSITHTKQPDPNSMLEASLITFVSDRDGPLGIYVMNADVTGNANVLTIHTYYENWPAWSPNGEQIAYSSERDGNSDIFVMNADGSGEMRLTDNQALDGHPSWSPDGSQIAFESDRDGDGEIFIMDVDGSNVIQLTENTTIDAGPFWSPDGSQIAFLSVRDSNVEIYVMDADGSNITRLTNDPADDLYQAWSPDGQMIAFTSNRDGNYEIYVMNVDGSGLRRLTNNPAAESYPSWSPPGEVLTDVPWFGPPWCSRDTDGDMQPDTPTSTFLTSDMFAYIVFPFRNMEDGMVWSHNWVTENSGSMCNMGWWNSGESGFHVAMFSAPTWGSGPLTIQLLIDDEIVQEIRCDIVEE